MFVIAYTLIDPATMLEIIDKGVDGIETDYPGVARALLPPGDLPRFIRR